MNPSTPSTQAEISHALEEVLRDFVRAASWTVTNPEELVDRALTLNQLRYSLAGADASADLSAAFEGAVEKLTAHEPESEVMEAQLDVGRMAMRHMIELASDEPMRESRTAESETNLDGAVRWLRSVWPREASRQQPPLRADQKAAAELEGEKELAREFSVMVREALRAISANDPSRATLNVVKSFMRVLVQMRAMDHSYSYIPVFEETFTAFANPPELPDLELDKLALARAGMRFLATRTDRFDRPRKLRNRLDEDTAHFERNLNYLVESEAWKEQPRQRAGAPEGMNDHLEYRLLRRALLNRRSSAPTGTSAADTVYKDL